MACKSSTFVETMPVFSDGSTTYQFIAFKRVPVGSWVRARVSASMNGNSNNGGTTGLTVSTAARYADTDDGFPSATPVAMPDTALVLDADEQFFGATFKTLDTSKQMVEFGVQAKNSGAGALREMAQVTLIIDLQE